jgi:RHS repeat-associated protein
MNRLVAKLPSTLLNPPSTPVHYAYNVLGLRTNMTDASGATAYAYDGRNRLAQKTKSFGGTSYTSSLNYSYDENGNVTGIQSSDPNGVQVGYGYDALNRLSAVNDAKVGVTTYSYDGVGNLQGSIYPNLLRSVYQYDALNRLTNLAGGTLLTPIANYAYTVGASGNRLTASEQLFGSILNTQPKTINRLYTYDDVYRLTGESLSINNQPSTLNYGYDPVGNRLSRLSTINSILSTSASFDANDRLNTDSYDANGNTLIGLGFGQSQADQYDFENRLTSRIATVNGQPTTINIQYDGDGNRVRKSVTTPTNTVTTFYVVDELNPSGYAQVLEEHVSLNYQPSTIHSVFTYGHTLISQDRLDGSQWTTSFYGYDGHNNVRYLTDLNGNVTDTYDYDAFGNVIAATGNTPNLYLFTGEQFDLDLGLYYLRARYHNSDTGRFWTQDSYEGNGSDPSSLHKYTYCRNNPANSSDPSGHMSYAETGIASTISLQTRLAYGTIWGLLGGNIEGARSVLHGGSYWGGFASGFALGFVGGAFLGPLPASAWQTPGAICMIAFFQSAGLVNAYNEYKEGYTGLATLDAIFSIAPSLLTISEQIQVMTARLSSGVRTYAMRLNPYAMGAKRAPVVVTDKPLTEYIYGPRNDPKINTDGSTKPSTWTSSDVFTSRASATDRLDPFKPIEGRRRVTIPAGSKVQKGITPGGEGLYNGEGGANETLIQDGLPPGSVGPFEPL